VNPDWYPTRLLDLSMLKDTGRVLLTVAQLLDRSSMKMGEYITLSHCWGTWGAKELPVLTTANIDERVSQGIDLDLLPQTFKDAVEIAGWFNGECASPLLASILLSSRFLETRDD
jgi:hypothetical protein